MNEGKVLRKKGILLNPTTGGTTSQTNKVFEYNEQERLINSYFETDLDSVIYPINYR